MVSDFPGYTTKNCSFGLLSSTLYPLASMSLHTVKEIVPGVESHLNSYGGFLIEVGANVAVASFVIEEGLCDPVSFFGSDLSLGVVDSVGMVFEDSAQEAIGWLLDYGYLYLFPTVGAEVSREHCIRRGIVRCYHSDILPWLQTLTPESHVWKVSLQFRIDVLIIFNV